MKSYSEPVSLPSELLSVAEMYQADRLAMEGGVSGATLMEAAGKGIADLIIDTWPTGRCLVICGPGNNGGDGYVVARHLTEAGWQIDLASLVDPEVLTGDAALMRDRWEDDILSLREVMLDDLDLVVDAGFGAGFSRFLESDISTLLSRVKKAAVPVVAVDMPSGVNGDTGAVDPGAIPAAMTVTFFRAKPGHFLYPGRSYCGRLQIIDIGIDVEYLEEIDPETHLNGPDLWRDDLPLLTPEIQKYSRGHAAIVGGGISSTGAARLAARASLRAGAGATTIVSPPSALMIYAAAMEAVMVTSIGEAGDFADWLQARRIGTVLIGPGNGVTDRTREFTLLALESAANVVIDADALTVFRDDPDMLFSLIREKDEGEVVLTPHEAEFERIFSLAGSKLERARTAAALSGAVVLLKGADTVISTPDGKAVINYNAPPYLATAGSGDVLAGLIAGLFSGGMTAFSAAATAVWIHGAAGNMLGPGLISEDIENVIPEILSGLFREL
ncbi:NAD(P)H-hydrate dehydratase [Sneathiella sp. CAU 1612]|uniref:Bifunctional NAD(P)H-hydrate repair enzyme n=1 Tax=Sneathiella sedimenti TaxID=2816034 RepID=A0ABS3F946_9PROT|nr:NAD(P)H-hydrate dehydratase [Sneathiella sedimenti]MBO0335041.1 NAD(P)H-hydrate dehydratase [Sneathiella sedimenti]